MRHATPNEAAAELTNTLLEYARECIGKRTLKEIKSTHPWMTERVVEAVAKKRGAEGTELEQTATEMCSKVILEARTAYTNKTKQELQNMKQGSKQLYKKS